MPKNGFGMFVGSTSTWASAPDSEGTPSKTCKEVFSFYLIQMGAELPKKVVVIIKNRKNGWWEERMKTALRPLNQQIYTQ